MTDKTEVIKVNGIKNFRVQLTEILEAVQNGAEVHVTTYTHGREARSVIKLEKIEDLSNTAGS